MNDFLKFAKTVILVVIISFGFCVIFTYSALWLNIKTYGKSDLQLSPDCHTLIVGNSMAVCAFNDTILSPWRNIGKWQQFYIDTDPALDLTLNINHQIDTVLLVVGIPAFNYFYDYEYTGRNASSLTLFGKNLLLDRDLIKLNLTANPNFFYFLLTHGMENLVEKPQIIGSYFAQEGHCLFNDKKSGIKGYEERLRKKGSLSYSKDEIEQYHKYQIQGLKKLISTCRSHGVECILVNPPLYNFDHFLSDDGYKELLSSIADSLLIADYSSFQFPDTSYYRDVHHLNYSGSVFFSNYLKNNGLSTQYVVDYANGVHP